MKDILFFLLVALFCFCLLKCKEHSISSKTKFTVTEWNYALEDSIGIGFSFDSIFKPVPHDMDCFDDRTACYTFGYSTSKISINYWLVPKSILFRQPLESGTVKANQIRDAYPNRKIDQPKIISTGMLDGVYVENSDTSFRSINYVGHNQKLYMAFDIKIDTRDTTLDLKNTLLSLVKSISIQKKE